MAHFHLAGSGAPGKLTEVQEATDASQHKGFRFPQNSLLYWRLIFSVFSTISWPHPFPCSQATVSKKPSAAHGSAGAGNHPSPHSPCCTLCHGSWLSFAILVLLFPSCCSLLAAKPLSCLLMGTVAVLRGDSWSDFPRPGGFAGELQCAAHSEAVLLSLVPLPALPFAVTFPWALAEVSHRSCFNSGISQLPALSLCWRGSPVSC